MEEIKQWIEQEQAGKSGIYPFRLAERITIRFHVDYNEAVKLVFEHIQEVLNGRICSQKNG